MEEKELKTSTKQRVFIILIAIVMLGSMIAGYAAIVINGGKSTSGDDSTSNISEEKIMAYEEAYKSKVAEMADLTRGDFEKFMQFKSEIVAYNETAANTGGVQTKDLLIGDGRTLEEEDNDYRAYYVGWCADESIFDSSLDDNDNPTAFNKALDASLGMIEGWNVGVVGMNIGGIREITIPGELAYKDQMEICGGYNKPLKFLVMAVANEDPLKSLSDEVDLAYLKMQYAYYGIDYDAQMSN